MDNLTITQIQEIIARDAHTRALRYARTQRWREAHPDEHREKSCEYMRKYNERKKAEKAAAAANPEAPEIVKKTRVSAKQRIAMEAATAKVV